MTTTVSYVHGAERMVTAAWIAPGGVAVRFADDREGVIPLAALELPAAPVGVTVPGPHRIEIQLGNGATEEVPWDFARNFADDEYRGRSEALAAEARNRFGERLRTLRSEGKVTQQALADRAGVSRVTIARIESGERLPRYQTLMALARGLGLPMDHLLTGG